MTARDNLEMHRLVTTVKTMMTQHARSTGTNQLASSSTLSPLTVVLDGSTVAIPASRLTSCPAMTTGRLAPDGTWIVPPSRVVVHVWNQQVIVYGPWESDPVYASCQNGAILPQVGSVSSSANLVVVAGQVTLVACGNPGPYTWSIATGSLPTGLSLNTSTGVISGTPTVAGTFSFTVEVTDSLGFVCTRVMSIVIYSSSVPIPNTCVTSDFSYSGQNIATPAAPTVTNVGTAGSTTYDYVITAIDAAGETVGSPQGTTSTGNATLSGTNYNAIAWTSIAGATSYNIYRITATGSEWLGNTTSPFNDTGAVIEARWAPSSIATMSLPPCIVSEPYWPTLEPIYESGCSRDFVAPVSGSVIVRWTAYLEAGTASDTLTTAGATTIFGGVMIGDSSAGPYRSLLTQGGSVKSQRKMLTAAPYGVQVGAQVTYESEVDGLTPGTLYVAYPSWMTSANMPATAELDAFPQIVITEVN